MSIDAERSRAARELLGWTQAQLAEAAAIRMSTVKNFECDYRKLTIDSLSAVLRAFEQAGIVFENDRDLAGVKLKLRRGADYGLPFDPKQSRAARELLGWTQAQLAEAASIRFGTLRSFESEQQEMTEAKLWAVRRAFEEAGIVFENDGKFVGVKVKIRRRTT